MAKKVVRYLLEGQGCVPSFILDGGYWPVGAELVGVSVDEDERHLPSSVNRMSKADLVSRLAGIEIHDNVTSELLDSEAKEAMLEAWLAHVGMSDLE